MSSILDLATNYRRIDAVMKVIDTAQAFDILPCRLII